MSIILPLVVGIGLTNKTILVFKYFYCITSNHLHSNAENESPLLFYKILNKNKYHFHCQTTHNCSKGISIDEKDKHYIDISKARMQKEN